MKILKIESKIYEPKSILDFKVALIDKVISQNVIIRITTEEGIVGYGEAAPFQPVTGDNAEETKRFIDSIEKELIGEDPLCIEKIHRKMDRLVEGHTAAKAGIDMALYDIMGKKYKTPLYKLLGGGDNKLETDMTLGIDKPEKMSEKALEYVNMGFRMLKVKTGINPEEDLEAIRLIREKIGNEIELRLDANQGWDCKGTINIMKQMEKYNVLEVEQPVPFWDLNSCRMIKNNISQYLMLDESVHSPQDAVRAIEKDGADMINIKLMKSGGLYKGMKINSISEANGIPCMIGCMSETRIGIAAASAIVAAKDNIILADVDSHYLIEESPYIKGGFEQDGGKIKLLDKPGLGVEVDFDKL